MSKATKTERIPLVVTDRAKKQDADLAMKADPIRAIIELVTNSDDAYGVSSGKISIELIRRTKVWAFSVRDRAGGMDQDGMKSKLLRVGAETSGFEYGESVRGNLGRGAKDVSVFGTAKFESIKNGRYTCCTIHGAREAEFDTPERDVSPEDLTRLGLKRNSGGTLVTVEVTNGTACPQFSTLKRDLVNHYQLRDILKSEGREVTLRSGSESVPLKFRYPPMTRVLSKVLTVEGYPHAKLELEIDRLVDEVEEQTGRRDGRIPGLLLKGKRAIYENTFFSFENRAASRRFVGNCRIEYVDQLAREYSATTEGYNAGNPIGIIRRDRDGLEANHPFYIKVREQVDPILKRLIEQEERSDRNTSGRISEKLKKRFQELSRKLSEEYVSDTSDEETSRSGDGPNDSDEPLITVIPPKAILYVGETKSIYIKVASSVHASRVRLEVLPSNSIELADESKKLKDGKTTVRITPKLTGTGTLIVRAANETEVLPFEVRPHRPLPPPIPTKLEFEKKSYNVKQGRQKRLRLVAPEEVVFDHGDEVRISIKGESIITRGNELILKANNKDGVFNCHVEVEGRLAEGSVKITANCGDTSAFTSARISSHNDTKGTPFTFDILDEARGEFRSEMIGNTVVIYGRHPAVKRILGAGPKFPHHDDPAGRYAIAEIIAWELVRKILEERFKEPDKDASEIIYVQRNLMSKYLKICLSVLL